MPGLYLHLTGEHYAVSFFLKAQTCFRIGCTFVLRLSLPVANHTVVAPSDLILLIGTGLG